MVEVFRIRPEIIYSKYDYSKMVTEEPDSQQILDNLREASYKIIRPTLNFPVDMHFTHAEAFAAYHFVIIGNFPKSSVEMLVAAFIRVLLASVDIHRRQRVPRSCSPGKRVSNSHPILKTTLMGIVFEQLHLDPCSLSVGSRAPITL